MFVIVEGAVHQIGLGRDRDKNSSCSLEDFVEVFDLFGFDRSLLIFDHYRAGCAGGLAGSADDALIRFNDGDRSALFSEDSHWADFEAVLADRACFEIQGHIGHPFFASMESCLLET